MKSAKGIFSLMMVALLLLSTFVVVGADETSEMYTINAVDDVMSGGQGVGFFDNAENSTAISPEKLGGGIITRPMNDKVEEAEWVKYPIPSTLTAGTYNVQVYASSTADAYINIGINDTDVLEAKRTSTGAYTTFEWTDCGNVYLDRNYANCLKLSNANGIGVGVTTENNFSVKEIKLTKVNSDIAPTEVQAESYYTKDVWSNSQNFPSGGISGTYTEFFAGNKLTYDVSFLPRGQYSLSVRAATNQTPKLNIYLNGSLAITLPSVTKGGWSKYNDHIIGTIDIIDGNDGLKTISIENVKGGSDDGKCQIDSFTLTYVGEYIETYEFDGYSDIYTYNDGANTSEGVPNENGGAMLRTVCSSENTPTWGEEGKEWVKYKLPDSLTAGTYKVELKTAHNYGSDTWANIGVDDTDVLEAKLTQTGWGAANAKWNDCGTLYLDTDYAECIRVSSAGNVGVGNADTPNPFALNAVRLTKVNDDIASTVVQAECYSVKNNWHNGDYVWPSGGIANKYTEFFADDKLTYDVSFLPSGEYSLTIQYGTKQTPNINVYVNGALKETLTNFDQTTAWGTISTYDALNRVKLHLDATENKSIALEVVNGKCVIDSFTLTYEGPYQGTVVFDGEGVETDKVVAGNMRYIAEIGDFGGDNELFVVFAIYKKESTSNVKQLYKVSVKEASDCRIFKDGVTGIEIENGYEYSYKVFVWEKPSYTGYFYGSIN